MKKVLMSLLMLVFCIFICNASYAAVHWSELTYYKRQTWQEYYGTACSTHGASCTPYLVTHKNADGQVDKHWMHIVGTTNKKGSSGEPTAVDGNLHPWLSNLWDPGVFCCIHDNTFAYNSEQNKLRQHTFIEGTSVTMRSYNPELKSGYANKVSRAAQWAFILSESSSNGTYDAPRIKENYDNIQAYCLWTVVGAFEQGVEDCGLEQFKMPTKTHGRAWLEERINLGDTYAMQHKQEILDLYDESKAYNDFLENRMEPRSIDTGTYKETVINDRKICGPFKVQYSNGVYKDEKFGGIYLDDCTVNGSPYSSGRWYFCDETGKKMNDGPESNKQFYISISKGATFDEAEIDIRYLRCYASYYGIRNQSGMQEHIYVTEAGREWEDSTVYLYGGLTWLDIIKVDKTTKKPMQDVGFIVQRVDDNLYVQDNYGEISYVKDIKNATVFKTDSNGKVEDIGLLFLGKYRIIEQGNEKVGDTPVLLYEGNKKYYDCITATTTLKHSDGYYKFVWEIIKDKVENKSYDGFYKKVFEMLVTENDVNQFDFYNDEYLNMGIPSDMDAVLSLPEDYLDDAYELRKGCGESFIS